MDVTVKGKDDATVSTYRCIEKDTCKQHEDTSKLVPGVEAKCYHCHDKDNCNGGRRSSQGLGLGLIMMMAAVVVTLGM